VGDTIGLDGEPSAQKRWAFSDPGHNEWAAQEVAAWKQTAREAAKAGDFDPDLPVAVILAGAPRGGAAVRALQVLPATASRYGLIEHTPGASHASMLNARFGDAIIRGIVHVRDARTLSAAAE